MILRLRTRRDLAVPPVDDLLPSPDEMRRLAAIAKAETLRLRAAIEQQEGVRFDRDGCLLRDGRSRR